MTTKYTILESRPRFSRLVFPPGKISALILAIGLSNWLCACRKRTASWVRQSAAEKPNVEIFDYFKNYVMAAEIAVLSPGVYTLEDLMVFSSNRGWCPYFLARHMFQLADVIVCTYQYLLDPKVAGIISKEKVKESVVVFEEAHNIGNVCIDPLSVRVRRVKARKILSKSS